MANDLPFVGPLVGGSYFLEPEELFGMRYALMHEGWPIPLKFYTSFPVIEHPVAGKKYQIIYTGYRPVDTFTLHKQFSSLKFYNFNVDPGKVQVSIMTSQLNLNRNPEKRPFVGMRPALSSHFLNFDSKFEGGNLDRVVVISDKEYDLYIRSDTNSKKKFSWFFFMVSNCRGKGVVRFNVVNFNDPQKLYEYGMKPVVSLNRSDWDSTIVDNVTYAPSKLNQVMKVRYGINFNMLSFDIEFGEQDKWFVARSVPYLYSHLLKFLAGSSGNQYFKHKQLCKSIGGLHVPKITITNPETPKSQKTYILITARSNPGESVSSFKAEGLIKYLLSDSEESCELRNTYILKIIPMCNPEGVVIGNSRSTVTGISIHHKHSEFTEIFATEPKFIKKLAYKLNSKLGLSLYIDLTSSFINQNTFIHSPYPKKDDHHFLLTNFISEYLARHSQLCRTVPKHSRIPSFPMKVSLEKDLRIQTFVIETSIFGYKKFKMNVSHDPNELRNLGSLIGKSIYFRVLVLNQVFTAGLKLAASFMKSDKDEMESEESSLESDQETEVSIKTVFKETFKQNKDKAEYLAYQSSDDEDLKEKDHLLESFQDFCAAMSKKKIKKKVKLRDENVKRITFLDQPKDRGSLVVIKRKNKPLEKPLKDRSRKELEFTSINFSQVCSGSTLTKTTAKVPAIIKKQLQPEPNQPNHSIFEIPSKKSLSQSVLIKPQELKPNQFRKFGPFPDLKEVKILKLKKELGL